MKTYIIDATWRDSTSGRGITRSRYAVTGTGGDDAMRKLRRALDVSGFVIEMVARIPAGDVVYRIDLDLDVPEVAG